MTKPIRSVLDWRIGLGVVACACLLACSGPAGSGRAGEGAAAGPDAFGVQVQRTGQMAQAAHFVRQPLDCDSPMACPVLGLQWSAQKPNQAVLQVGFARGQHAPVTQVEFLARPYGPMRVRTLAPEQPVAQPESGAEVAFQMPMASLERLVVSRSILLRVTTAEGRVHEENLVSGEHSSPAFEALQRWMQQIHQGTEKEAALGLRGLFARPDWAKEGVSTPMLP